MNGKQYVILPLLVACFVTGLSGICLCEDLTIDLIVKNIAFDRIKGGMERITLFCNQPCGPELFSIEEENPRVVMDLNGVVGIQTKSRRLNTRGKLVKRVRNYLDNETKILRIVLDMEPLKYYIVRQAQQRRGNVYVITVEESADPSMPKEKRITIIPSDVRPDRLPEKVSVGDNRTSPKDSTYAYLVKRGRVQWEVGEFAAAVDTFTQILKTHPDDSLSYRLRGNAYDNLGDRDKAAEDWKQAARLGDTTLQSYLDFLEVKWRGNSVSVGGAGNR